MDANGRKAILLRHVPRELHRQAKLAACQQGLSLMAWVEEAMQAHLGQTVAAGGAHPSEATVDPSV